ncbi:hypothetical protein Lste_2550 [Legionella steelei]|uniref:Uncharacterized protein n=1 Tax=Legionella steelei TaxID=947033 RepID=A0A0W0ZK78_9GAMM|nr:hypothetical protein Lste_2550 [Legionella steelei]
MKGARQTWIMNPEVQVGSGCIGSGFPLQGGLAQRRFQDAPHAVSIGSKISRYRVKLIISWPSRLKSSTALPILKNGGVHLPYLHFPVLFWKTASASEIADWHFEKTLLMRHLFVQKEA